MEHRRDLEDLLLAGLPERERSQTLETMKQARLKKLARLRRERDVLDLTVAAEESGELAS